MASFCAELVGDEEVAMPMLLGVVVSDGAAMTIGVERKAG